MQFHETAAIFPMMTGAEFAALVADIKANGLREPIWTWNGQIIDGRNRFNACQEAGIKPSFQEWNGQGSLVAFIVSLNLHRRHLDESQRALVGARIKPMFEAEAKERQGQRTDIRANLPEGGRARDDAAAAVNVSSRSVESASKVLREGGPELIKALEAGTISVSAAATIADAPKPEQAEIVARGTDEILAVARRLKREKKERLAVARHERRETPPADLPPEIQARCILLNQDIKALSLERTVDCILTDPPYPGDFLPLFHDLGNVAEKYLKDGGSLVVMCGQFYFPQILSMLLEHKSLNYHWLCAYHSPGESTQIFPRKIYSNYKPLLWLVKGPYAGDWTSDFVKSDSKDKDFHEWGQSVSGMVEAVKFFSKAGETILDPFMGGGSVGVAALLMNRKFIGSDIDEKSVTTSRERIAVIGKR